MNGPVAVAGAEELVGGLLARGHDVTIARRCTDLVELLAVVQAGLATVVLVAERFPGLDRASVGVMRGAGATVVGVPEPGRPGSVERLLAIGVDAVADQDPDGPWSGPMPWNPGYRVPLPPVPARADPVAAGRPGLPPVPVVRPAAGTGRVLAVWGPGGAPGRTTVATSVAWELARSGATTLLVDADTHDPAVAAQLGLLPESSGLAAAARAADRGDLDAARLADLAVPVAPRLRVLTGLPDPSRWFELAPAVLESLWQECRRAAQWTVVDCAAPVEAEEEVETDLQVPRRNGATLSALAAADGVVVVGAAEPIGLVRLVRALSTLHGLGAGSVRPTVAVTRVRASAVGPGPEARVRGLLSRYARADDVVLVPDDRAACDRAVLTARVLGESSPASPARIALAGLAGRVSGRATATRPRGRFRPWQGGR